MALALALGLGWLCLAPRPAHAQTSDFRQAQEAYMRGQYAEVVGLLAPLIAGHTPIIRDRIVLQEARKLLGAAFILTGDIENGRRIFGELLDSVMNNSSEREFADFALDPAQYPQVVLDEFDRLHGARLERLRAEREARQQAQREAAARRRAALLAVIEQAQTLEYEEERDPAIAFVPFGVGQFANGDEDLGLFFFLAEAVTFFSSWVLAATYAALSDELLPLDHSPSSFAAADLLNALVAANWASAGSFVILAVAGIIEARVNFVSRRRVRRERELPPSVLEQLDLGLGPGGVTLTGRF